LAAAKIKTKQLAMLSISAALQTGLLVLCLVLPTIKISMLFASSLFNGMMCAAGYKKRHVFMSFVVVSVLSLILIPNYIIPAAYIALFGGYGIIHIFSAGKRPIIKQLIRYAYLAVGASALFLLFKSLFISSPALIAPYVYFIPPAIIAGYFVFQIIYDKLLKEFFRNSYLRGLLSE